MPPRKKSRPRARSAARVSHYLSAWADDAAQTERHLAQVLIDALCALKRLQLQGALDAYPEWKGEGSAMVQLGVPTGPDAKLLVAHPFLPPGTPLMVVTGSKELTQLMVGFSRGVFAEHRLVFEEAGWKVRALGPSELPPESVDGSADRKA